MRVGFVFGVGIWLAGTWFVDGISFPPFSTHMHAQYNRHPICKPMHYVGSEPRVEELRMAMHGLMGLDVQRLTTFVCCQKYNWVGLFGGGGGAVCLEVRICVDNAALCVVCQNTGAAKQYRTQCIIRNVANAGKAHTKQVACTDGCCCCFACSSTHKPPHTIHITKVAVAPRALNRVEHHRGTGCTWSKCMCSSSEQPPCTIPSCAELNRIPHCQWATMQLVVENCGDWKIVNMK